MILDETDRALLRLLQQDADKVPRIGQKSGYVTTCDLATDQAIKGRGRDQRCGPKSKSRKTRIRCHCSWASNLPPRAASALRILNARLRRSQRCSKSNMSWDFTIIDCGLLRDISDFERVLRRRIMTLPE